MKKNSQMKKFSVKRSESGLGLFTNVPLKKGDFVIEYTGKLLTNKEVEEKGGRYLFEVNSRWTVDGSGRENISRYINHSCRSNCEIKIRDRTIKIYALKKIKPGDELNYHYGREYFKEYIKPFGCRCAYCRKKNL